MDPLMFVLVVGLVATTGALVSGVVTMGRGGGADQAHSHQYMFARVGFQALTVICLIIGLYLAGH